MLPKCKAITRSDGPGGPSSVPDDIWAREFDSIVNAPVSPYGSQLHYRHIPCKYFEHHSQAWRTEVLLSKNSNRSHIRTAARLVWITGMKSFPKTSICWMFHWFTCMYLESSLLSAVHSSPAPYKPRWVLGYLCSTTAGKMAGTSH